MNIPSNPRRQIFLCAPLVFGFFTDKKNILLKCGGPGVSQPCHYVWVPCLGHKGCKWFDIYIWNLECPPRYFPSLPLPCVSRPNTHPPTLTFLQQFDLTLTLLNVFCATFVIYLVFKYVFQLACTTDALHVTSLNCNLYLHLTNFHCYSLVSFLNEDLMIWYCGKFLILRGYVSRSEDSS